MEQVLGKVIVASSRAMVFANFLQVKEGCSDRCLGLDAHYTKYALVERIIDIWEKLTRLFFVHSK